MSKEVASNSASFLPTNERKWSDLSCFPNAQLKIVKMKQEEYYLLATISISLKTWIIPF